jgi:hypothetical protein
MRSGLVRRDFRRVGRDVQPLVDRMVAIYILAQSPNAEISGRERTEMAREARDLWWLLNERLLAWTQDVLGKGAMPADHAYAGSGALDGSATQPQFAEPTAGEGKGLLGGPSSIGLAPPISHPAAPAGVADRSQLAAPAVDSRSDAVIEGARRWKLEALKQVRLLVGRGYKKIAALAEIAGRINHSVEYLQRWERELVATAALENQLYCAELVGEFDGYLRTAHYSNIPNYRNYGSFEGVWNMERAAHLSREIRYVSLVDIGKALRNVH